MQNESNGTATADPRREIPLRGYYGGKPTRISIEYDDHSSTHIGNADGSVDLIVANLESKTHQPVAITDDILEAVINEHDMNVPDDLLASPGGFGAHREAMRTALQKIIPLTLHIEAEYKRAMKRESIGLQVGEFSLFRRGDKIAIHHESGEGGDFSEAELAASIKAFYAEHF